MLIYASHFSTFNYLKRLEVCLSQIHFINLLSYLRPLLQADFLFWCPKVPLVATSLPLHAAPAGEVGEPALETPHCLPASDGTGAGSKPQRLAVQPKQTSGRCSSCEKAMAGHCSHLCVVVIVKRKGDGGTWGLRKTG